MHLVVVFLCLLSVLVCAEESWIDGGAMEATTGGREKTTMLQQWRRQLYANADRSEAKTGVCDGEAGTGTKEEMEQIDLSQEKQVIVTGSSSNHFRSLKNFLASALDQTNEIIVVYDLGLDVAEAAALRQFRRTVYRKVDLRDYETHVSSLQVFAWKPILVHDILQEVDIVLWLDAGCLLHRSVKEVFSVIAKTGAFFTTANSYIGQLTHPSMIERFGAQDLLSSWQVNGGVVGFSRSSEAYEAVVIPWRSCALDLDCIAPAGSDRRNHRQDQSVLSILVRQQQRAAHELSDFGIAVHQDQDAHLQILHPANGSRLDISEFQAVEGVLHITVTITCPPDVAHCCLRGSMIIYLDDEEWLRHPERFWCKALVVDQSGSGHYHFHLEEPGGLFSLLSHGEAHSCGAALVSLRGEISHSTSSMFVPYFVSVDAAE